MNTAQAPSRRTMLAMFVVAFGSFMDLLDSGIVTVVIPEIQRDLDADYAQGQWFVVAYVVAFAVVLITGGRLGDIFGRKRIFQIGVLGFTALSLACALAQSAEMLIVARGLQGAFAALMTPQVFALIQVLFPPDRRAVAFVIYGAVINLAQLTAPLLGGLLTTYDLFGLGWRLIFVINVPIGLAIVVAAGALVPESRSAWPLRLDPVGIVLIALMTALIMYPLQQGRDQGWPAWMFVLLAAALPLLGVFLWYEHRRGHQAVLPTSLFRRSFTAATFLVLLVFSTIVPTTLVLVWFTQLALGWSPLRTAQALIGFVLGLAVIGAWGATKTARFGRGTVAIGILVIAAGVAVLAVLTGPDLAAWQAGIGFFIVGAGMALVIGILITAQLYDVPSDDSGVAGGVISAVMQYAAAIGIGIFAMVFFGLLSAGGQERAAAAAPGLRAALSADGVDEAGQARIVAAFRSCVDGQARQTDPYAVPPDCHAPELAGATVATALDQAQKANFADSAAQTLWYLVVVLGAAAPLCLLLPRRRAGDPVPAAGRQPELAG